MAPRINVRVRTLVQEHPAPGRCRMDALTEQTVKDYLRKKGLAHLLGEGSWQAEPITEGNVNLLFRV